MALGNTANVMWFARIGEYVIDWGPGYRIFLAKDGDSPIVLFRGGTTRRQQADIDRAGVFHAEYKARKTPPTAGDSAKKRKR
jgi:putative addiction module killer protein